MTASWFAPESPTSAFDNQSAGSDVPQADATLDIHVQSSGGDIGQRQGSLAEHPDFPDTPGEPEEVRQGFLQIGAVFGKAD